MTKKIEDGVAFYRQKRITGTVARILFGGMTYEKCFVVCDISDNQKLLSENMNEKR